MKRKPKPASHISISQPKPANDAVYAWRIGLIADAAQKFYGPRQPIPPTAPGA